MRLRVRAEPSAINVSVLYFCEAFDLYFSLILVPETFTARRAF